MSHNLGYLFSRNSTKIFIEPGSLILVITSHDILHNRYIIIIQQLRKGGASLDIVFASFFLIRIK